MTVIAGNCAKDVSLTDHTALHSCRESKKQTGKKSKNLFGFKKIPHTGDKESLDRCG